MVTKGGKCPMNRWLTEKHKEIACSVTGKSKFNIRLGLQNVGNCQLAQDTTMDIFPLKFHGLLPRLTC